MLAVLGTAHHAPLLVMSSTELPSASSQAPRATNGGTDAMGTTGGGGELCEAPAASFVRWAHEDVAPFTVGRDPASRSPG
jgi:hypothetical protein